MTVDTMKAFVDIIIPRTPKLAASYDDSMLYGAVDFLTYEYLIWSLNHYNIPIAEATAELLDAAASQLVSNYVGITENGMFAALSPNDRLKVLIILDELGVSLEQLPEPFDQDPELVLTVLSLLNKLTMLGYYSEWYGYGATRLNAPDQRKFEYPPLSWIQVGYPGPSFSYRAYVMDYYKRRDALES